MPAATNKADLLIVTEKEFAKLTSLLDQLDTELAVRLWEDETSIKDVIAHRAHWIDLFLGWYADGMAGNEVFFPAKGYKWNELKAYNAAMRAQMAGLSWPEVRVLLTSAHDRLMTYYSDTSDGDLYNGPMKGANNKWTPGRWSEAAGASHYRSAAKFVRKCLRDAGA